MAICFVSAVRTTLVPVTGGGCTVVTGGGCTVVTGGGCNDDTGGGALLSRVVAALFWPRCCHWWSPHCFGALLSRVVAALFWLRCCHWWWPHCCHGWWLRCSGGCAVVTGGGRISDYVNKSILQDKDTRRRHWTLYPPWPSVSCQRYGPHWSLSRVVAALLSRVVAALLSRVVAALLSRVVAHCCHGWSPHCFGALLSRVVAALFWLHCCHWWWPHCCHGWWLRCSGGCAVVTGGGRISDYVNKSILQDKDTRRRHWTLYPPWPSVSCQRYIPHWSLSRVVAAYQITSTSRSFKIRTPGAGTGLCTHHGHLFRVSGTDHTGPCHG